MPSERLFIRSAQPRRVRKGFAAAYPRSVEYAGRMNIAATLARITYTYTNLNTYENNLPASILQALPVRDIPYKETKEMKFGNDVHTAFELRIGGKKLLPVEMQQWEGFATPFDRCSPSASRRSA